MGTQFDVTQKLVGVKTSVDAVITATGKNGGAVGEFDGVLTFDWNGRTIADALKYATCDRRIAIAPMIRKSIGKYRTMATVTSTVTAPGTREFARIITTSDVETFLRNTDDDTLAAIVARVTAARANTDVDADTNPDA